MSDGLRAELHAPAAPEEVTCLSEALERALDVSQGSKVETSETRKLLGGDAESRDSVRFNVAATLNAANFVEDGPIEAAASEDTSVSDEDGQSVREPCSSGSKWVVGAPCQAVWAEDGRVYPAEVVCVNGQRCRVRFSGYNNEEEVELSALRSPDVADSQTPDWRPGSRCRAVYSEDGLVYPAVVLWVKGQRCRVRFDSYNNEEEQDLDDLLDPDQLLGPGRAATVKDNTWRSNGTRCDWRRRKREENQSPGELGAGGGGGGGEEGERRSFWRDDPLSSSSVRDKLSNQRGAEKPTNHSAPTFPPFPPPPQLSSGGPVAFVPPPPPPPPQWMFGEQRSDSDTSMLMLWYLCGFHTGSYMALQAFRSSSKH